MQTLKNKINEALIPLYDKDTVTDFCKTLENGINGVMVKADTGLGFSSTNPYVIVTVGLDEKKDWSNGIFMNSRYFRFSIDRNGSTELLVCNPSRKMRKFKAKNAEMVIKKVNEYIKLF